MIRVALLANPEAGSGGAEGVAAGLRAAGAEVNTFELDGTSAAVASRPDRIVAAGGDGSLGAVAAAAVRAGVPLAVVPVGTANDLARSLEIPPDPAAAARMAALGSVTRRLDLAWMNDLPFLNVASIGLAPAAARKATGLKRIVGALAYAVGGIRAGLTAQPVACRVRCDGDEWFAGRAWQVTVASSGAFGAGAEIEADPADGLLDTVVIEATARVALALRAYGLRHGSIRAQRGVRSRRSRAVELDVAEGTEFNVDGEVVESGPARFVATPRAVEVIVG